MPHFPTIQRVSLSDDTLTVDLADGRSISIPLTWYPRLLHGAAAERRDYRLTASGRNIHWNQLNEDISCESILSGQPTEDRCLSRTEGSQWPEVVMSYEGVPDFPAFESYRDELLPPTGG